MTAASLTAIDISCRRGERLLFRGLSLTLDAGDALHVIGPNGVGKSSLIRILAGLLRPFAGSIKREGAIGLIDERHALDPELPIGRVLRFWADLDGVGHVALENCGDRLGLTSLFDVPVRFLSTGQRKRAVLARLLARRVPIWLLDEPLNGLDSGGVALVEELITEHLTNGGLAVIASHQPLATKTKTVLLAEFAE